MRSIGRSIRNGDIRGQRNRETWRCRSCGIWDRSLDRLRIGICLLVDVVLHIVVGKVCVRLSMEAFCAINICVEFTPPSDSVNCAYPCFGECVGVEQDGLCLRLVELIRSSFTLSWHIDQMLIYTDVRTAGNICLSELVQSYSVRRRVRAQAAQPKPAVCPHRYDGMRWDDINTNSEFVYHTGLGTALLNQDL